MLHLYYGNGKGKTSTAVGMCIRAHYYGTPVIFAQFLKDDSSGEVKFLKNAAGVRVMHTPDFFGFYKKMPEREKTVTGMECRELLKRVSESAKEPWTDRNESEIGCLIVLDEILTALEYGIFTEDEILGFIREVPKDTEIVLTGKTASKKLLMEADYASEIKKIAHPYEKGVRARYGIEK